MKNWRIYFLFVLFAAAGIGLFMRLFRIQIIDHNFYSALAQNQSHLLEELTPKRGEIFIQDKYGSLFPLVLNRDFKDVYLVPKEIYDLDIEEKAQIAERLAPILEINKESILAKINKKGDPYEPLKSKIEDSAAQKIKDLHLKGVYFSSQSWRWYPQDNLSSHLLGFVGFKDNKRVGQYGLEEFYEKELAGETGILRGEKDAFGRPISIDIDNFTPAKDGSNLILTIDRNIQFMAEEKLGVVLEKWQAEAGTIIIENPKTGAIKAMASFPNYNPNEYFKEKNIEIFLNPATQKLFEPGSIFKPITVAAGLDSGKVTSDTTYTDTGLVQILGRTITNAANRSYGLSSVTRVLERSINTGAVFVQKTMGPDIFKNYVQAFGFDHVTDIDLGSEISGNISNLNQNREINFATASFGQGIAVTPIQVAAAISAIANQGKMMRPYLVEKIIYPDGSEIKIEPQVERQPITDETAEKLTKMLVSTVKNGYDKIKIRGYDIAGKTGTAQIPTPEGYSGDQTIHSFVGYAPAYDPIFLVFIKMDKPKGINFASDSLTPAFAEIAQFLFNYYEIPPGIGN